MLYLEGKVLGVFEKPKKVSTTGKPIGGGHCVQVMAMNVLSNGAMHAEIVTMVTKVPEFFEARKGKNLRLPVGVIGNGKGVHTIYVHTAALNVMMGKTELVNSFTVSPDVAMVLDHVAHQAATPRPS